MSDNEADPIVQKHLKEAGDIMSGLDKNQVKQAENVRNLEKEMDSQRGNGEVNDEENENVVLTNDEGYSLNKEARAEQLANKLGFEKK